ncbi:LAME_0C09164g1_1 [Lachancea meyersii CBS 8951]|uniref:LAME_0C09164g1_1 n=1 Tax=Lachancea meyersii CBS 8951 TaxID=1266667 RepID=A0A1G4J4A3_9SACH|nr:LAME_0C09164g1_1 [Lachancea meyersii CBS 8951]
MALFVKVFLATLCLTSTAFARYSNASTTSVSSVPKTTPTAFFSTVSLVDSYTGTSSSTDKEHWFLLQAEIYVSAGFTGELYLAAPESLQGFPEESFDLVQDMTSVGTVSRNSSNIFTIRPDTSNTDKSSTFNVLASLSSDLKSSITGPQTVDFEFDLSPGSKLVKTIDFIAQDLSKSQTNAQVDEQNRVTYTLDIPFSEYPGALNFAASFSYSESFSFDTSLTSVQVVTAVDAFNQPTKGITLTAVEDNSDESSINLSLTSQISGGKFIRISYTTTAINNAVAVDTLAILNYPTLSTYKRDISITFEDRVVLKTTTNVDSFGEVIHVMTGSGAFPTVSGVNSTISSTMSSSFETATQSSANETTSSSLSTSTNGTSVEYTVIPIANGSAATGGSATAPVVSATISASNSSTATITPTQVQHSSLNDTSGGSFTSNSKGVLLTYTVVTRTSDGEYEVYTSFFPVATLTPQLPANSSVATSRTNYVFNSAVSSTNAYPTRTVFNRTFSGEYSVYTSLVPVATLSGSETSSLTKISSAGSSVSQSHGNKSLSTSSASSAHDPKSTAKSSQGSESVNTGFEVTKTTKFQTKAYLTYSVITTTSEGKVFEYTSWFPVTTLSPEVSTITLSQTSLSESATTTVASKKKSLTASVFTQTKAGQVSVFTSMVPVQTQTSQSTQVSDSQPASIKKTATGTKSTPSSVTVLDSPGKTATALSNTTILDSSGHTAQSLTTKYGVSSGMRELTRSEIVFTSESLIGGSYLGVGSAKSGRSTISTDSNVSGSPTVESAVTKTGVSTNIANSTQHELLTTYEHPIGASTQSAFTSVASGSTQVSTPITLSGGAQTGQKQSETAKTATIGRSTLSSSFTIQYQSLTSVTSSRPDISTFDGAGNKVRGGIVGAAFGLFACLV